MKYYLICLFTIISSLIYSQCNYKTITQNGVVLKQFYPKPIGGDNIKQIAVSISNIDGNNNLSITIRFLVNRTETEKQIKLNLTENNILNLTAERIGNDNVGGSQLTLMIFSLDTFQKEKLLNHGIQSITINESDTVLAKLNNNYISESLKCFN